MKEKVQGLRNTNWQVQNRQGEVENSIGNGEAKQFICMTQGHELREGVLEGMGIPGGGEQKEKTWDNSNSIINKIYLIN